MVYTFVNKNLESAEIASDGLIYLDGRLSNYNKVEYAKKKINSLKNIKPNFGSTAVYIAPFNLSTYDSKTGKYIYLQKLIKL